LREAEQRVYIELLRHLHTLRSDENVWLTTPGQVNEWWRLRNKLHLVPDGSGWRLTGDGSERACLAYAHLERDAVTYEIARPQERP
jgi:hypothetical protein